MKFHNGPLDLDNAPLKLHNAPLNLDNAPLNLHNAPLKLHNAPLNLDNAPLKLHNGPLNLHNEPLKLHNEPLNLHNAPLKLHNGPLKLHNAPLNLDNAPLKLHNAPLNLHNAPLNLHNAPLNLHNGPLKLHNGPLNLHNGPFAHGVTSNSGNVRPPCCSRKTEVRAGDPKEVDMRRVRYEVAMSLDGYIAGPNDETDWMLFDPEGGFFEFFTEFDTFLHVPPGPPDVRDLEEDGPAGPPGEHLRLFPDVAAGRPSGSNHRARPGGGSGHHPPGAEVGQGHLDLRGWRALSHLLDAGLVDALGVAIIPVLLGGGVPLLPPPAKQVTLKLIGHKALKTTGTMSLSYEILNGAPPDPPSIDGKEKLGKVLQGRSWGKAPG